MNGIFGYLGLMILVYALFLKRRFHLHLVRLVGSTVLLIHSFVIQDLPFFLLNLIVGLVDAVNAWRFRKQ